MKRIAFASHVALIEGREVDGIGNSLIETLSSLTDEFLFVRHSMEGLLPSEVHSYRHGKITKKVALRVARKPSPLRYAMEVLQTVRYFSRREKIDVYIGVDPLNAVAGIFLKKIGKVETAVFLTADYSPHRFGSKLMNWIYHRIDMYCVRHASEVWSVSSRIVAIRKRMGLRDEKNILLPNVPPKKYDTLRKAKRDKFTLITSGNIDKQLDFKGVFRAIKKLEKKYPKLRLEIAGNGPEEASLKKYAKELGVDERVKFIGRMPLGELMEYVSKAGVGLALYTGVWGFNEFGDSTKCREYFNFGLPVLSTDTHSTVEDIKAYECGRIVAVSDAAYEEALEDIFENYERYSQASAELGKKYSGVHQRELKRVLAVESGQK